MMSIGALPSAKAAADYYKGDNYYTDHEHADNSEWFGKAAESLGLNGPVTKEDFESVLEGKVAGQELGKWVKNPETGELELDHRPGLDITFSAPKSFSILTKVFGDKDLADLQERAVKETLAMVEEEYAKTRLMEKGVVGEVDTGKLAIALFKHDTSRDGDPQDHVHAIVSNLTQLPNGQFRSHTNDHIYHDQKLIGAYHNAILMKGAQDLGWQLEIKDGHGNFELKGFSDAQLEHFSQRSSAIDTYLRSQKIDPDQATPEQKQVAALATRSKKMDIAHPELKREWSERAAAVGLTESAYRKMKSEADSRAVGRQSEVSTGKENLPAVPNAGSNDKGGKRPFEYVPGSMMNGINAVYFAVSHVGERQSVFEKRVILEEAIKYSSGQVHPKEVKAAWNVLVKSETIFKVPNLPGDTKGAQQYTTRNYKSEEDHIIGRVKGGELKSWKIIETLPLAERLAAMERKINEAKGDGGFKYTEGQRDALQQTLTNHDRFVGVQGLAGTGKTTLLKAVKGIAEDGGFTVRAMAPYGQQAQTLEYEMGVKRGSVTTVVSFLAAERRRAKAFKKELTTNPHAWRRPELWIVDESSALPNMDLKQLQKAAIAGEAKVIFVGDKLQTQSIGRGRGFETMQDHGLKTGYMTEVNRQKTDQLKESVRIITVGDIVQSSQVGQLRDLKHYGKAFDYYDKSGMVTEKKGSLEAMVSRYLSMEPAEQKRTLMVTPLNRDRKLGNELVRSGLILQGQVKQNGVEVQAIYPKDITKAQIRDARFYKPGEYVRFHRAYKSMGVANDQVLKIQNIDTQRNTLNLTDDGGRVVSWSPHKATNVSVYEGKKIIIAEGDQIKVTGKMGELLTTGNRGVVDKVTPDSLDVAIKVGSRTENRTIPLGKTNYLDYGYISTVHGVQGDQNYRELAHMPSPDGTKHSEREIKKFAARMGKIFGSRSGYVTATRPTHEFELFTDNKAVAREMFMARQENQSPTYNLDVAAKQRPREVSSSKEIG